MLNAKKPIAVLAAAIGITAGMAVFLPGTASAATYGGQCGEGFNVIDKHDLKGGTVFLTYNGRTNCVVTVRDKPGEPISMGAAVRQSKDHSQVVINDDRTFTDFAYAKVEAEGKCIDWGGRIKDDLFEEFGVHCG
ncbi:spore-associated protein A [Nocardia sp. NPDC050630]|uniref:spore-associated protein A n=1 Tax=Nocardia sp. NPDC050630 TaxID=3364321 RepID=UPI0037B95755